MKLSLHAEMEFRFGVLNIENGASLLILYSKADHENDNDNIKFVELSEPIDFEKHCCIRPICLPTNDLPLGSKVSVVLV